MEEVSSNRSSPEHFISELIQRNARIVLDTRPLPPVASNSDDDEALITDDPFFDVPMIVDYGFNFTVGPGTYLNRGLHVLDTCKVTIGSRVLVGPNVSLYTASHPTDAAVRQGLEGPEFGKEISIGDDCWIGGNVVICPGVRIGRGSTVGAGSVVTKSVAEFVIVGGNPAKVIKHLPNTLDDDKGR